MLGVNVFAADTDEEARFLATSMQQAFVNLRSGRPGRLPPPESDFEDALSGPERQLLAQVLECSASAHLRRYAAACARWLRARAPTS